MKNILPIIFLLYFLSGCYNPQLTHKEVVTEYYNGRNSANFSQIRPLLNDSITIISGDYVMPYDHASFYEVFQWDSIFRTSYTIVGLDEKNNQVIASVTMSSLRNEFLKNNKMTCDYKISFNSGKILKIEEIECKDVDWEMWQKQRDSLVDWIKQNHPELNGFIHDMTMNGAVNYLKAIELYNKK